MSENSQEMGQAAGALSRAAGMVQDAKADLDKITNDMHGRVTAMSGGFRGQGGAAFQRLVNSWTDKQKTIVKNLDNFEQSLRSTEQLNTSTDDQASASMNKLAQGLGG